ncbi:MAG TPA: hypothetical protein VK021_12530 [Flavobacteriaceae bacterium]|nr:hypothetical protein [Flavobacteriaceae bacterium]
MNTSGVSDMNSTNMGEPTVEAEDRSGNKISNERLKRLYKQDLESRNNPIELE